MPGSPQHLIGHKPFSEWGEGDTQAQYAVGSVVYIYTDLCQVDTIAREALALLEQEQQQ